MSRLVERLLDHAAAVAPRHRRAWIEALRAELPAIENRREALAFALGGVLTAYRLRISPMRLALLCARLSIAAIALLTALVHLAAPTFWLAVMMDLKQNGLGGWAGQLRLWRGRPIAEVLASADAMPAWHMAAYLGLAIAFGVAAWSLVRWDPRRLLVAAGAGAALAAANQIALNLAWPSPYIVHPSLAWADYLAFALLAAAAGGVTWALRRPLAG